MYNTSVRIFLRTKHLIELRKFRHNVGDYAQNVKELNGFHLKNLQKKILKETVTSQQHMTPGILLHLITPDCRLYHQPISEVEREQIFENEPFWAFYWPGGQALSRFILENPEIVQHKSVLDVGSGCAASSIAALKNHALYAIANDIDEAASCAAILNARLNSIDLNRLKISSKNLIGSTIQEDIILIGDLFYDEAIAALLLPWLHALARNGKMVLIGDPGRHGLTNKYMNVMTKLITYELTENCCLENNGFRYVNVWRLQ